MSGSNVPSFVWVVLGIAIFGVSSAGAIFTHVDQIPPLLRASWRLQLTALLLAPLAFWQWFTTESVIRNRVFEPKTLLILMGSGFFLALHFGFWVTSLDHTSLTHSLLFVTAHPLVILVGMFLFVRKPSRMELIGGIAAFTGAGISLLDAGDVQGEHSVTFFGDQLAFFGAVFVVGYIVCGRILREWMPLFIYAFPVTLIGGLLLIPASSLLEGKFSSFGAFGYFTHSTLGWFLLLAFIAGILGHTGLNYCLKYISPLLISISVTLEPVIGSIIGWLFFSTGVPGLWTWVGGPILLLGIVSIIYGEHISNQTAFDRPDGQGVDI
ncbi:MAG: DMT family transporter [Euryarchaeota archaeon TMED117]|nr:MAG: DMT family transporter [Euryarchaeota archaeon TMED117]|tara:strand:+ start:1359 stop:2330 length:972 start_codon:yes stop_codon:yes gene_type:complete